MRKDQPKSKPKTSHTASPEKVLAHLQEMVLQAVLSGKPLPGGSTPLRFPDLSQIVNQPKIVVARENLAGNISVKNSPKPVSILSSKALRAEVGDQGEIAYLRFEVPTVSTNQIELTLEARVAS